MIMTSKYLLAFSCKYCHFCPSCHQIRVVEFGEWFFLHIIATDGCFYDQDGFIVGPRPDPKVLEHAFRLEVSKLL